MISVSMGTYYDPTLTTGTLLPLSQTLTSKPEQQWYIQSGNTTIQLANSTLCLDAGAKSELPDCHADEYLEFGHTMLTLQQPTGRTWPASASSRAWPPNSVSSGWP